MNVEANKWEIGDAIRKYRRTWEEAGNVAWEYVVAEGAAVATATAQVLKQVN